MEEKIRMEIFQISMLNIFSQITLTTSRISSEEIIQVYIDEKKRDITKFLKRIGKRVCMWKQDNRKV